MKRFKGMKDPRLDRFRHRKRWARRLGILFSGLLLVVLLGGIGFAGFIYLRYIKDLPDFTSIKEYRPPTVSRIYARDGRLLGEFYAERRIEVPYSRLPRHLILAFVAAEDARFFEHPGVDVFGIIRAFVRNLEAGEIVQGGSTITQQVVKRILLNAEKSFARKVKEAVLAYRIDKYLTKEEILEIYLNNIFLGHGAYGVEAAAQEFFGKHVEELNLAESALLAGIPKAPSRYSPIANPRYATDRQAYVLRRMAEEGFISRDEAQRALNQPLVLKPNRPGWLKECGYFTEHVRGLLEDRFGKDQVMNLGLKVFTTADVNLHRIAQESIKNGIDALVKRNGYRGPSAHLQGKELKAFQARHVDYFKKYPPRKNQLVTALVTGVDRRSRAPQIKLGEHSGVVEAPAKNEKLVLLTYISLKPGDVVKVRLIDQDRQSKLWKARLEPAPTTQGALISMELESGKVRVLMGGKDFYDSSFNRAVQARRQPGSAFKPVIYAAAIEQGYGPNSILYDEPLSLPGGRPGQLWSPENYDHTYSGPIPLSTALARSRNIPAVRLMMSLGVPAVVRMAATLGISSPIYPNYASALGASEVTLLELTRAYSVFPNQGRLVEPVFIERIEDRDGRVLYESRPVKNQVISPEGAEVMTQLLIGVVERGTGTRVKVLQRPIGGKTGTTNRTRDAWFIGFTPSIITGVWVGMDDERSLGPKETGSQAAAPIFISYMREALKGRPVEQFPGLTVRTQTAGVPQEEYDDEAVESEELFYPEEQPLTDVSPTAPSSTQQFFKSDMGG
ncbi:MAG: PBP1A family penicillin-binding protein [Deltaproteobacteria bacterium]|nr:PBP1A family penicillin-binding protein [Deltaproteobacteria bacterium]